MARQDDTNLDPSAHAKTVPPAADSRLLVHVHITKTGGSTLNHILRSSYGAAHCPVEPWDEQWGADPFSADDLRRVRRVYPNLKSIAGHQIFGHVDLEPGNPDLKYFALFRDPVKACASRFQHKIQITKNKTMGDFEEWAFSDGVRNRHTNYISGTDDVAEAIRVIESRGLFTGLTANFDETLVMLRGLIAPDLNIAYTPVNVARDKSIAQWLLADRRSLQIMRESQAADLELFEYVQELAYPRQREEYGPTLETDLLRFRNRRDGFNKARILLSRLKAHAIYRPLLFSHRKGWTIV